MFIAVEKEPPFACAVYQASKEHIKDARGNIVAAGMIEAGMGKIGPLLELYARCYKSGEWPGYVDSIEDLYLKRWAA
jgi:hypothetical protein